MHPYVLKTEHVIDCRMDNLENTVIGYSAALTSPRASDRKKGAENIKDLLTRNALPSMLSKNTLKKKGFTWNDLFDDINDYIHKVILYFVCALPCMSRVNKIYENFNYINIYSAVVCHIYFVFKVRNLFNANTSQMSYY